MGQGRCTEGCFSCLFIKRSPTPSKFMLSYFHLQHFFLPQIYSWFSKRSRWISLLTFYLKIPLHAFPGEENIQEPAYASQMVEQAFQSMNLMDIKPGFHYCRQQLLKLLLLDSPPPSGNISTFFKSLKSILVSKFWEPDYENTNWNGCQPQLLNWWLNII